MEIVHFVLSRVQIVVFNVFQNRSSNSSSFFAFPSKVGMVVVGDLGNFEILLILLWKLAKLLLVANC